MIMPVHSTGKYVNASSLLLSDENEQEATSTVGSHNHQGAFTTAVPRCTFTRRPLATDSAITASSGSSGLTEPSQSTGAEFISQLVTGNENGKLSIAL